MTFYNWTIIQPIALLQVIPLALPITRYQKFLALQVLMTNLVYTQDYYLHM